MCDWLRSSNRSAPKFSSLFLLWSKCWGPACTGSAICTYAVERLCVIGSALSTPWILHGVSTAMDAVDGHDCCLTCLGLTHSMPHPRTPPLAQSDVDAASVISPCSRATWTRYTVRRGHSLYATCHPACSVRVVLRFWALTQHQLLQQSSFITRLGQLYLNFSWRVPQTTQGICNHLQCSSLSDDLWPLHTARFHWGAYRSISLSDVFWDRLCYSLVAISSNEVLQQSIHCQNVKCRRTDDILERAYSATHL